jgi:hypothetical protein
MSSQELQVVRSEVPALPTAPSDSGVPMVYLGGIQVPVHRVLDIAVMIATQLKDIISKRNLYKTIGAKNHVYVEGWTTLGSLLGVLPAEESSVALEDGSYESVVHLLRSSDQAIVGRASAVCGTDEPTWKSRPRYARKSMATTRATGKAYRLGFSWLMVMAGYDPTPLEEMREDAWGVIGSKEAQAEVARRKIQELESQAVRGSGEGGGVGVTIPTETGSMASATLEPPPDIPELVDDEIPTGKATTQQRSTTRKPAALPKTTKDFKWLREIGTYKDVLCVVGCESDYYKLLEKFGIKHSNELVVTEDQQKLLKAVRLLALECESKAAGGKLYSNPKWCAIFPDEQAAIRATNFAYAVGRKAKNSIEQVDSICEEQINKGWDAHMIADWWKSRNLEAEAKLKGDK